MTTARPWRDKETLERLYWDEALNQGEVAERLGCTRRTISVWMNEHDIETRKGRPVSPWVNVRTDRDGYERWQIMTSPDTGSSMYVHRLLAIAKYGPDIVKDKHVHHKNGIRWDNRPENIGLLDRSEHSKLHYEQGDIEGWGNEEGLIAQHGEKAVQNGGENTEQTKQ